MRVLFLCTAHNSLSQRLYLALSLSHHVTIEFALSEETMISAVALSQPDIIICPFLTTLVPKVRRPESRTQANAKMCYSASMRTT